MPTINKKLLLRLFGAIVVLGAALGGIYFLQSGRVPDALLWQANHAAENGKMDKAIGYMRQYLEFRPDDHDAADRLGDMVLRRANSIKELTNAQFLFEKIVRENPARSDVRRKLIRVCIRMGRHADALIHAEPLLKETPNDGILWGQVAECLVAQTKWDDARAAFEKSILYAPDNIRAYDQFAQLLVKQSNQPDQAKQWLDRMVRSNPSVAEAFLVRGRFIKGNNQPDEALRDFEKVFELDPENADALMMTSEIYQGRGDLRRARDTLQDGVALYRKDARFYRALSWMQLGMGNPAEAMLCLEQGIKQLPNEPELLTPLGDLWVQQGEIEKVQEIIRKLESRKNSTSQVSYLKSRVLMRQGKWAEALGQLESLRTDTVSLPGLAAQLNLLIGMCHDRLGNREAQNESLKRVFSSEPGHFGARVALANTLLNAGKWEEGLKEYATAARMPYSNLQLKLAYARLLLNFSHNKNISAEEWTPIVALLEQIQKQHPQSIEPTLVLAEALAAKKEVAAAEKILQTLTERHFEDVRTWVALAQHRADTRGFIAGMETLEEARKLAGDSVEVRLAQARLIVDDWQTGRAERLAQVEEGLEHLAPSDQLRVLRGLADLYTILHDERGMMRVYRQLTLRDAKETTARIKLYLLAEQAKDTTILQRLETEFSAIEGKESLSLKILHAKKAPRNLAEVQDLVKGFPVEQPDAQQIAGDLFHKVGDLESAQLCYEQSVRADSNDVSSQSARLNFYLNTKQNKVAQEIVERLALDPRLSETRFRAILERSAQQVGGNTSEQLLAWSSRFLSRDPRLALWAAQTLDSRGRTENARRLYQAVQTLAPQYVDGWAASVVSLSKNGQETLIPQEIAQARSQLTPVAYRTLLAETGLSLAKQPVAEIRLWTTAQMASWLSRGQTKEALTALQRIIQSTEVSPEDRNWATQQIAKISLKRGNAEEQKLALETLRRQGNNRSASVVDIRDRVDGLLTILGAIPLVERRPLALQGIQDLSGLVKSPEATARDWFSLAQLQSLAGDRTGYQRSLESLMERDPECLIYVAAYVDSLISEQRVRDAEKYIDRLTKGVHDFRALAALARYSLTIGEAGKIVTFVDRFVNSADVGTTEHLHRQLQAAELLDQLARQALATGAGDAKSLVSGACERYRTALTQSPESILALVGLLSLDHQVPEAFEELNRVKGRMSPLGFATAAMAVLRSGNATARQFNMVKGWLEGFLSEDPNSLPLKLHLGELHTLRQDFATAEQLYREVLRAEPKNVVALNNLAWILGPKPESAEQALVFAQKAIELYGATGELLDTRARILIATGRYDQAIEDLNEALNQSQTSLRYFHLAIAQLKQSKKEEAFRTFKQAKSRGLDPKTIHPNDLPTYKLLSTNGAS